MINRMKRKLTTYGGVYCDGNIWFSNNSFNALCCLDLTNNNIEIKCFFPNEELYVERMHKKCFMWKSKIIFIPAAGKHIHIYDLISEEIKSINVEVNSKSCKLDCYADAVMIGDKIYLLPINCNNNLEIFDLSDYSLKIDYAFKTQISRIINNKEEFLLTRCQCDMVGDIHFGLFNSNFVAKWDINERILTVKKIEKIPPIFSAQIIDDVYWVIPQTGNDIYSIGKNGCVQKYSPKASCEKKRRYYNRIIKYGNRIIALPAFSEKILMVDETDLLPICSMDGTYKLNPLTFDAVAFNDDLLILPFADYHALVIKQGGENYEIPFQLMDSKSQEMVEKWNNKLLFKKWPIVYENIDFNVHELIDAL